MKRHCNFTRLKMDPRSTWLKEKQPPLLEHSLNPSLCLKLHKQVLLELLLQMPHSNNSNSSRNNQHLVECREWVVLVASEEWGDSRTCKPEVVLLECKEWVQLIPIRYRKWCHLPWFNSCSVTLLSWIWWSNRILNCVQWSMRIHKSERCCLTLSYFKAWWLRRTWTQPREWCKEEVVWEAWARWVARICLCQEEEPIPLELHSQINQIQIPTQRWWEEWVVANLVTTPMQAWWVEALVVLEVTTQLWCKLWWVEEDLVLQQTTDLPVKNMLPN